MLDIRYIAGLFDADGLVRVQVWAKPNSSHVRYQVKAAVGMTHRPIIEQLHARFDGSLHLNRPDKKNKNHRPVFVWNVASQKAAVFLQAVLPYLVVKREQAELALQLQASIDKWKHKLGHRYGFHEQRDEIFAERKRLAEKISALKKQSFPIVDYGPSEVSE
jgi:hypothetical protein